MIKIVKNNKQSAIVRLVVLVILIVNQTLITLGYEPLPFSDEQIYEAVSIVALVVATLYSWWMNNNVTEEALAGQAEVERLKERENNDN